MKFTVLIDDNCDQALHESTSGDAFALDPNRRFALFGGQYFSTLVDLNEPKEPVKTFSLKTPLKWFVTNYEWDALSVNGNERFLQTRNKLIELVNCETSDTQTLTGHGRCVNEAKWSPFKRNILASTSADSNIILWSTETPKPAVIIPSIGEPDCLAWNKLKDNVLAVSCNNDIRIYDIRKSNSALRYISNAHTKKIYSLDWCANEEILLSSSRDRNIKLWNFNMRNQKFMEKILEDFPCWKAKFTPFGLCFVVIPTCLSPPKVYQYINESVNSPNATYTKYPLNDISNTVNPKANLSNNASIVSSPQARKNEPITSLLICQIVSFDEAKIYKFTSNQADTILNFDYYSHNDKFKIVSWSQNQNLCQHSIDLAQLAPKGFDKSTLLQNTTTKYEEDTISAPKSSTTSQQTSILQVQPNTTNSSRKSSISEYCCGTPPSNLTSILSNNRMLSERESINLNGMAAQHDFLKRNPKCFGAKFTGLPEQMIIFSNEFIGKNHNKINKREHETKRPRSHSKNKPNAKSHYGKQITKPANKVYIYNVSFLLNIKKEFAERYQISDISLQTGCDQNVTTALSLKRFDIVRIWELMKFITLNYSEKFSLNPDHGRPWSCSTFGRPLIMNIIDNSVKSNDIQSAAMIISKLKQHDMSMVPNASTVNRRGSIIRLPENSLVTNSTTFNISENSSFVNEMSIFISRLSKSEENDDSDLAKHHRNLGLLDPMKLNEFDIYLKFYCEILYKWSLYIKRIEMLEFIYEKPSDYDEKFECAKVCAKCYSKTNNSKCKQCQTYLLNCSICFTPVNGLSTYCVICGHGGHYSHLIDWFKRHEDCPSACGCRCIDYL